MLHFILQSSRTIASNSRPTPADKMTVYGQTGTHKLKKWLPLRTMKQAAGSEVLFVNQSSIPISRHWATQPGVSLGRTAPCSSPVKLYDSKDCLPKKPHCPQQVMITRKIDKVKWSPHSNIHHYFIPSPLSKIKVYTSAKYLYFWLKDIVPSFPIYVDLLVLPFALNWLLLCF